MNKTFLSWLSDFIKLLLLAALVAACLIGWKLLDNQKSILENQFNLLLPSKTNVAQDVVLPATQKMIKGDIAIYEEFNGAVAPLRDSSIADTTGKLTKNSKLELLVKAGQQIKKEDILFIINGKKYFAPFDGLIIDVIHNAKNITVKLLEDNSLRIFADVSIQAVENLKVGDEVIVNIGSRKITGTVEYIALVANGKTVNIRLMFENNKKNIVRMGTEVKFKISVAKRKNVNLLPISSVLEVAPNKYAVQTIKYVDDEKYLTPLAPVEIGLKDDKQVEIVNGLKPSDEILVHPDSRYGQLMSN